MFIKQKTQQLISPIRNTYLYEFANIPEIDQDLVKKLSLRALNMIFTYTAGKVITETEFDIFLDVDEIEGEIRLPIRPILDITEVSSYDSDNTETVLSAASYYFIEGDSSVFLNTSFGSLRNKRALKISMKAGYDLALMPFDIQSAVEQLTVFLYENRGDSETKEIPLSIRLVLDPYVIHRF